MKQKQRRKDKRRVAKPVLRLPDLDAAKSAVLNSLSCPHAQRGYRHAIDEFVDWYCSELLGDARVLSYSPSASLETI